MYGVAYTQKAATVLWIGGTR